MADYHRALHHDVYQLNFFLTPEEESYPLSRMPGCAATRWSPYFSDITPRGGSKRIGIEKMLAHFGIPASDTMAFGDGGNDIEMLRFAGVGVAMGNAGEEVRQAADDVTDDVDHDGIQNALRRFGRHLKKKPPARGAFFLAGWVSVLAADREEQVDRRGFAHALFGVQLIFQVAAPHSRSREATSYRNIAWPPPPPGPTETRAWGGR